MQLPNYVLKYNELVCTYVGEKDWKTFEKICFGIGNEAISKREERRLIFLISLSWQGDIEFAISSWESQGK